MNRENREDPSAFTLPIQDAFATSWERDRAATGRWSAWHRA
ncbi:hypothetical protein AB0469_22605 [Streptomyces sp. NPDC093801]